MQRGGIFKLAGLGAGRAAEMLALIIGHEIAGQTAGGGMDGFQMRLPCLQFLLGIVQHLASRVGMRKGLTLIARHDGGVVEVVQEPAPVLGEDDLLLGALDSGGEVDVVGFLELLPGLCQVSMG